MIALLTTILVLGTAVLMPGVINRTRAYLSGRKGIRLFQHLYDAQVMVNKGVVIGQTTTWLTKVAPSVYLGSIFTALLFVPVGGFEPLLNFRGDIVMFAYLMGLSRITLILAAMDTGSSFEGMGASRDALYGAMVEPVLFIVAGTLALVSGTTSFNEMFNSLGSMGLSPEMVIVMLLLVYVMITVMVIETGRMPIDDPRTHLELTMIHEVMVLDYSGVDLAMITAGSWLKMGALGVFAANIFAAVVGGGWVVTLIAALAWAGVVGIIESFIARNKLIRNTTYILATVAIAFVLFMVAYMLELDIEI